MVVPALGIRLPYFDHRVIHGNAFAIKHTADQLYALPRDTFRGEIAYRPV
jgi:hypothetical protein